MSKEIRVGDILKIKDFDPMNVDVSYIQSTIEKIPKDGTIDLHEAERLATMFLRCADYCADLIAQAIRLLGHRDAQKKSQKSTAIERKIKEKVPATAAREVYGNDEGYIKACNEYTEVQAWHTWISQKYDNLIRAHVLCKDIMKSHVQVRDVSGWDAVEEEIVPEKDKESTVKKDSSDDDLDDFEIDI